MRGGSRTLRAWPEMAVESRSKRSYRRSSSARGLHVITCRATLDVPMELLRFVTRLLILERRRRCTPAGSRALTCREQAVMVLRRFRDRTRVEQLGRYHGISRATAYRYVDEGTEVLAARAPDLHEALERAREEGTPFVIPGGKLFSTDRLDEQVTSVKGEAIDAWYSGKHHRPGGNVQAVIRSDGLPLWASPRRARPRPRHHRRPLSTAPLPSVCRPWPTAATRAPESASTSPSRTPRKPGARTRQPGQEFPAARPPFPGRTRVRPAHPALGPPPAHHRQPPPAHPDRPRRPRPHPIRAQIHQVKIAEITSVNSSCAENSSRIYRE